MLAEVTGTVSFGKDTKARAADHHRPRRQGGRVPDPEGQARAGARRPGGQQGRADRRRPGRPARHPAPDGIEALARYIVDEVQDVYRLQGVKINDKHIEVIVRQMLRRVQITDAGDAPFIPASRWSARSCWTRTTRRSPGAAGRRCTRTSCSASPRPRCRPTPSSPRRRSRRPPACWTEAAIMGKRDELRGLKENVIVGRLIPAGTGLAFHRARKEKEEFEAPSAKRWRRSRRAAGGRGSAAGIRRRRCRRRRRGLRRAVARGRALRIAGGRGFGRPAVDPAAAPARRRSRLDTLEPIVGESQALRIRVSDPALFTPGGLRRPGVPVGAGPACRLRSRAAACQSA